MVNVGKYARSMVKNRSLFLTKKGQFFLGDHVKFFRGVVQ